MIVIYWLYFFLCFASLGASGICSLVAQRTSDPLEKNSWEDLSSTMAAAFLVLLSVGGLALLV